MSKKNRGQLARVFFREAMARPSIATFVTSCKCKIIVIFHSQPFNNWLDGTREDLVDMFIVHTLDEIQGLIDAHGQFKATLGEADKEFQSIMTLIKEVESFAKQFNVPGATINPYTNLTGNVNCLQLFVFVVFVVVSVTIIFFFCLGRTSTPSGTR